MRRFPVGKSFLRRLLGYKNVYDPKDLGNEKQPHRERQAPPHILDRHLQRGAGLVLDDGAEEKLGPVECDPADKRTREYSCDNIDDLPERSIEFAGDQLDLCQRAGIRRNVSAEECYHYEHISGQLIRPGQRMVECISHNCRHKDQQDLNAQYRRKDILEDVHEEVIDFIKGIKYFFDFYHPTYINPFY